MRSVSGIDEHNTTKTAFPAALQYHRTFGFRDLIKDTLQDKEWEFSFPQVYLSMILVSGNVSLNFQSLTNLYLFFNSCMDSCNKLDISNQFGSLIAMIAIFNRNHCYHHGPQKSNNRVMASWKQTLLRFSE